MRLNASKTKELFISYAKSPPHVPDIIVDNTSIERVPNCSLLGLVITDTLTWDLHCEKMIKKANTRLFFLKQLKRAKVAPKEVVDTFLAIVRPVLEYACQVWHSSLTEEQHDSLEKIQERALKVALPSFNYTASLNYFNIPTLKSRRKELCNRLFADMQDSAHKLHDLLPPPWVKVYETRNNAKYPLPKVKTDRFKKSFVPYCLYNFQ